MTNGYTVYEQLIASDWWWWQLSLDMPDQLLDIGNIVYQWVTLVDINGDEQPFTIGCKTTVGFSVSQIDYFQQDTSQTEALWSDSALVVGQTVNQQAQDLKEEPSIHFWSAGDEHAPEAEESYIEGNRVFVCSFAKELPKIGRNPNDFNKYFHIHVGARIYDSNIDTEHEAIPEQEGDIFLTAPPSYDFAEEWYDYDNIPIAEGAYQRVVSSIALIVAILALNF